jgi:hypothetical protein
MDDEARPTTARQPLGAAAMNRILAVALLAFAAVAAPAGVLAWANSPVRAAAAVAYPVVRDAAAIGTAAPTVIALPRTLAAGERLTLAITADADPGMSATYGPAIGFAGPDGRTAIVAFGTGRGSAAAGTIPVGATADLTVWITDISPTGHASVNTLLVVRGSGDQDATRQMPAFGLPSAFSSITLYGGGYTVASATLP